MVAQVISHKLFETMDHLHVAEYFDEHRLLESVQLVAVRLGQLCLLWILAIQILLPYKFVD